LLLERAGWYAGRDASGTFELPSDVQYPPQILAILKEFGGLLVRSSGSGMTISRASITFDPSSAEMESSEDNTLWDYTNRTGIPLYPLGYTRSGELYLCIDLQGNVYMVGDYLYWVGESFEEGISNILLGLKGKVLNDQTLRWQ
jgi:hypothetical protein